MERKKKNRKFGSRYEFINLLRMLKIEKIFKVDLLDIDLR